MVRCARRLRDRRRHSPGPCRPARRGRTVHLAGLFVMSAGRQDPRRTRQGSRRVALSMPIDYWDYLGWKDTLADSRFSARQKAYSHMRGDRDVYTPQMIVNGSAACDRQRSCRHRRRHQGNTSKADGVMSVPVTMTLSGKQLNVSVAASKVPTTGRMAKSGSARSRGRCRFRSGAAKIAAARSPTTTWCAISLKVGDWNGGVGKLDRSAGKYFPRRRRCRGRLCPGRQSRKAGRDARRGLHALR